MISQFCVLSPRGDTIISRDYRYDTPKGTTETFFRSVKLGIDGKEAPPVFHIDGVNYFHIRVRVYPSACSPPQGIRMICKEI